MYRGGSSQSVDNDMNEEPLSPTTRALLALVSHRSPGTPRGMPAREDEPRDVSNAVTRQVATGAGGHGRVGDAVIEDPVVHYLNLVNHSRPSSGVESGYSKEVQTAEAQTAPVQPEEDTQIVQQSTRKTSVEAQGSSSSHAMGQVTSHVASTDTRSPAAFHDFISCCDPNTPEVVYLNACPPSVAVSASSPQSTPKETGPTATSSTSTVTEQASSTTGNELVPLPSGGSKAQQDSSGGSEDLRTHTAGAQNVTTTYSIMISQQMSASSDGATRAMLDSFRTIQTIEQADSDHSPEPAEMDSSGQRSQSSFIQRSSSSSVVAQVNSPHTSHGLQPGSDICLKYPCETVGCTRAYLHKKDLIRHMRMMHNTAPQRMEATMVNVPPRPNVCGINGCMKSYIHYKDLVRHQKQVHYVSLANLANEQKRYPCDYPRCAKSYIHKKDLIRHKRLFHNDTSMYPTIPEAIIVDLDELAPDESSPTGTDELDLQMMETSNSEEPPQDHNESTGSPVGDLEGSSVREAFSAGTPSHHPTHHPCCPHHPHSHHTSSPHSRGQATHSSGPHSHTPRRSISWSDDTRSVGTSPVGVHPQVEACEGDAPTSESMSTPSTSSHQVDASSTLASVIESAINSSSPLAGRGHQPAIALSPWSALLHSMDLPSPTSTTNTAAAKTSFSSTTEGSTSELAVTNVTQTRVSPSLQMASVQHHSQTVSQMGVDQCSAAVQAGGGERALQKSGMQNRHPRRQHTNVPPGVQTSPTEIGSHNYKQQTHVLSGAQTPQTEIIHASHYKQHAQASSWIPVQQAEAGTQARDACSGMQGGRSVGMSPHSTCRRRTSSPSVLSHAESSLGHYCDGRSPSPKRRALCDASVQTEEYPHPSLSPYVNLMPGQPYRMSSSRRFDESGVTGGHSSRYDPSLFGSPRQEHGSFSPPSPRLSHCCPSYSHHQPIGDPYSPRYDWSPEFYESDEESCPPTPSPSLHTCSCGRPVRPPPTHTYNPSPVHPHHGSAFSPVLLSPRHSYDRHGQPMGHSHHPHTPEHYHRQLSPRISHSRQTFESVPDMQAHGPLEHRWSSGKQRRPRDTLYSSSTSHRMVSYTGGSMEEQQSRAMQRGSISPTWQTSAAMTSSTMTSSSSHYRGNPPYVDRQAPHPIPASRATAHTTSPAHIPVTTTSHSASPAPQQTPSRASSRQQSNRPKESERSISPLTLRLLALTRQTMHNDFSQRHHHPT